MKTKYEAPAIEVFKFSLATGVYADTASDIPENEFSEGPAVTLDTFDPFAPVN